MVGKVRPQEWANWRVRWLLGSEEVMARERAVAWVGVVVVVVVVIIVGGRLIDGGGGSVATLTIGDATRLATELRGQVEEVRSVGVLANTIVAWYPAESNFDGDGWLLPPEGWVVCDGANGTPDLRGRFIYGTDSFDVGLGEPEGEVAGTHGHRTNAGEDGNHVDNDRSDPHRSGREHGHSLGAVDGRPPFVTMAYIMKQ